MPALLLLGRKWHIATDDLPLPALLGLVWHGGWLAVISLCLSFYVNQLPSSCEYQTKGIGYLATHAGLFSINFLLHGALLIQSSRGSMYQIHLRKSVPNLVLACFMVYALILGNNVYGTVVVRQTPLATQCKAMVGSLDLNHVLLLRWVVFFCWAAIGIGLFLFFLTFNLFPTYRKRPDQEPSGPVEESWTKRCSCYLCLATGADDAIPPHVREELKSMTQKELEAPFFGLHNPLKPKAGANILRREQQQQPQEQCTGGPAATPATGAMPRSNMSDDASSIDDAHMTPIQIVARLFLTVFGTADMTFTDYMLCMMLVGVRHRLTRPAFAYRTVRGPCWLRGALNPGDPDHHHTPGPANCAMKINGLGLMPVAPAGEEGDAGGVPRQQNGSGDAAGTVPDAPEQQWPPLGFELQQPDEPASSPTMPGSTSSPPPPPLAALHEHGPAADSFRSALSRAFSLQSATSDTPTAAALEALPSMKSQAEPLSSGAAAASRSLPAAAAAGATSPTAVAKTPSINPMYAHRPSNIVVPTMPSDKSVGTVSAAAASTAPIGAGGWQRRPHHDAVPSGAGAASVQAGGATGKPAASAFQGSGMHAAIAAAAADVNGHGVQDGEKGGNSEEEAGAGDGGDDSGKRKSSGGHCAATPEPPHVDVSVLEESLHYMRFATAAYGWKMFMWSHRKKLPKCCGLCCGCWCCRQHGGFYRDGAPEASCYSPDKLFEREAIARMAGIPDEDLIYVSYEVQVQGLLPYYIALDRTRRSVVLAVRGSLSLSDVITDLLAEPAVFKVRRAKGWACASSSSSRQADNASSTSMARAAAAAVAAEALAAAAAVPGGAAAEPGAAAGPGAGKPVLPAFGGSQGEEEESETVLGYAHLGIYNCALAILKDIQKQGILEALLTPPELLEMAASGGTPAAREVLTSPRARGVSQRLSGECCSWRLVVTGHSLGGGVTGLLSLMLRERFPNMRAWAYAPPAGLMSKEASDVTKEYCISVVHAKDMIPRLSLGSMEHLVSSMVHAGAYSKLSKIELMLRLWLLRQKPGHDALFMPFPELTENQRHALYKYRINKGATSYRHLDSARGFHPPGHILYYERHKKLGVRECCCCNPCMSAPSRMEVQYFTRWISASDLVKEGMVVSRSMFLDHIPDNTFKGMRMALEAAKAAAVGMATRMPLQPHQGVTVPPFKPPLPQEIERSISGAMAAAAARGGAPTGAGSLATELSSSILRSKPSLAPSSLVAAPLSSATPSGDGRPPAAAAAAVAGAAAGDADSPPQCNGHVESKEPTAIQATPTAGRPSTADAAAVQAAEAAHGPASVDVHAVPSRVVSPVIVPSPAAPQLLPA